MYYQPPRTLGLIVGAVLALWAFGVAVVLFNNGVTSPVGPGSFLSYVGAALAAVLTAIFAAWSYALATLSYQLDRNGLVITWGSTRQVIPLGAIERLVPGTSVGPAHVSGVSWWGHHVGRARIERIGEVLFYSTHQSPEQVLYVMTTEHNYAISVANPADFAHQIQVRQELGPTAEVVHHVERPGVAGQAFWNDPVARGLALLALVAGALVWAQVSLRYSSLPATLELHFPPTVAVELVAVVSREAIFELPRTASALLAINLVAGFILHGWDRAAGWILLIAAVTIQLAFFAAIAIALA